MSARPALVCAHCGAAAVSQCSRCKAAFYCRRKCQKFDWKRGGHKHRCFSPEQRAAANTKANRERLWATASVGDEAAVLALIRRGVNVNCEGSGSDSEGAACTPLYIAAAKGHDAVVRALLDAGAEKDHATNNIGATSLCIAAERGRDAVVRALLDAGADKNHVTNHGFTPLLIAAQEGHTAIVAMLNP